MLKKVFIDLLKSYSISNNEIDRLWLDIELQHASKDRYYHNLKHLENLYKQLIKVKNEIQDWNMLLFALFYHDYIYNIFKNDNEKQSGIYATKILTSLQLDINSISFCNEIILATQGHQISTNPDINYFTDADLSILGSDWETYTQYYKDVRKEYKFYPDFIYQKGRIKVLQSFLKMPRIYKTKSFYSFYELQAKENIQKELRILLSI